MRGCLVGAGLLFLALGIGGNVRAAPTLQDFGYQHMRVNGRLALGSRPLLVMIATFEDEPPIRHGPTYYDSLLFTHLARPNALDYYREVSNDRFSWSNGGIVGPVQFTAAENAAYHLDGVPGKSYITTQIIQRTGLNLAGFDTDHDGSVTSSELGILLVTNQGDGHFGQTGAIDASGCIHPPLAVAVCAGPGGANRISVVGDNESPMTIFHELTHQLGAVDLYGGNSNWNFRITLMGGSFSTDQDTSAWHLDPWHKLQLGWCEPRLRDIRNGGIETLPAQQYSDSAAAVLLYDTTHDPNDFFLLEYRTADSPVGRGADATIPDNGLALWHVHQDGAMNPVFRDPTHYDLFHLGWPKLEPGYSRLWSGGRSTPPLTWFDDTPIPAWLEVHDFNIGAGSIVVEWPYEGGTWVDFAYTGPEFGTETQPFNTFTEGVNAAAYRGILKLKGGLSHETGEFTKRLRVETVGSPSTISGN